MISLSSPVFDLQGAFMLHESTGSRFEDSQRRVTRRPTLDGSVVVSDSGHTFADSIWQLQLKNPEQAVKQGLEQMVIKYQTLLLVTAKGAFTVSPSSFGFTNDTLKIELLVLGGIS